MACTTSAIRRSTPVAARKPLPVRSAAKTNAIGMATSSAVAGEQGDEEALPAEVAGEAVVSRSPADSPVEQHAAGQPGERAASHERGAADRRPRRRRSAARSAGCSPSMRSRKPRPTGDSHRR